MSDAPGMDRREAVGQLAALSVAALIGPSTLTARARHYFAGLAPSAVPPLPKFFNSHEWQTVRLLVDYLIPQDERSVGALTAGVPYFLDFMMLDRPQLQTPMRGGLHWLDTLCVERHRARFLDCTPAQHIAILDAIAWPRRARPEMSQGVAFFSQLRDLTATGFWSSPQGIADLQYMGNTAVAEWTGCPQAALDKLGVSY
jgi:gluconate 2-dehydrogenase gamma chain